MSPNSELSLGIPGPACQGMREHTPPPPISLGLTQLNQVREPDRGAARHVWSDGCESNCDTAAASEAEEGCGSEMGQW